MVAGAVEGGAAVVDVGGLVGLVGGEVDDEDRVASVVSGEVEAESETPVVSGVTEVSATDSTNEFTGASVAFD